MKLWKKKFFIFCCFFLITLVGVVTVLLYLRTTASFQIQKIAFVHRSKEVQEILSYFISSRQQTITNSIDDLIKKNQLTIIPSEASKMSLNVVTNCFLWKIPEENSEGNKKPFVILNPKKFLFPGLWGGPNNQVTGIKEAVYLAIKLNRCD